MNPGLNPTELAKKTLPELQDLLAFAKINKEVKACELQSITVKAKVDTYNKSKEAETVEANIIKIQTAITALE